MEELSVNGVSCCIEIEDMSALKKGVGLPKAGVECDLMIVIFWVIQADDPAVEDFLDGDDADSPLVFVESQ